MAATPALIEAVTKLACGVPVDVVDRVAQVISACDPAEARRRIADAVPHARHRSLALGFLDAWLAEGPGVTAAEVSISLQTAAHLNRRRGREQSVELAWTGPRCRSIPHRHTEQAILQVLDSARSRLLLVSYAVYSIPNIRDAVVRAARRGVVIEVVVETPDRLEGHGTYSTLQALGEDVAACSKVYVWPSEERGRSGGKPGILHVKCVVADGRWLFLSSANLTEYAFTVNMELGLLLTGGCLPGQVEGLFDRLIEDGILVKA
ncbi:DISARM system phospholipase D-like protein DrmC [Paludisphaera sp.]|uniref:DISARM system phospholipase D-like protein DrmC n=1 Tax=Paludisphaera sp. TaxID=2017432 RepID=UPI00301BF218